MRIGFFALNEPHLSLARHLIFSARKGMPGVEVWHLTDAICPHLPDADNCKRVGGDMPMAIRRMTLQSRCEGEWLFVDSDVVIRKDVSEVFAQKFDVALTDRIGTDMAGTKYAEEMPYNLGVTFSRSPEFWIAARSLLYTATPELQEWCGDQMIIAKMMETNHHFGFNVKVLPGYKYNFPPKSLDDPKTADASILHFKGARKSMISESAT